MAVEQRTESERILAAREQFVPRGIATTPIVVARAEGARVEDVDGKTYVDFAGGLGCQNTGHGLPAAVAAMHEQIDTYLHQCFMVGIYEPYVEVCRRLAELSPCSAPSQKSLLLNSGAEAVENAVKIARVATGKPGVVVFENAFHGRTLLTMTMTHKESYKKGFGPFAPEVYRARGPYPYRGVTSDDALEDVSALLAEHEIGCVVVEPVQGEGGFIPLPEDFPARLLELCREHGAVYVDDEVQSGVGRTGPGVGDRALRRRARPARVRQVARRRAAAGRGHRPRRADGRARGRRARRHLRREPGRLRRGARGARRDRARGLPRALRGAREPPAGAPGRDRDAASRTSARCAASARCSPSSSSPTARARSPLRSSPRRRLRAPGSEG